ncbi:MAG TPA: GntG family PLP-dependent aldolase [Anaerolineae bacterium]|nr:GntG family PLP-dependent aldolase [Anaerolineae bacterium]
MATANKKPDASSTYKSAQVKWDGPPPLDLRYEVTHKPPPEMWEAMMNVIPGMANAGQDKYVNELEALSADLTGKEAALFLPTTTNGTILAHMNHELRGKQVIMEARCHIFWVEGLHVSSFAGGAPRLIKGNKFGEMDLDEVESVLSDTAYGYQVPTGMVDLENTHNVYGGTVLSQKYTENISELAHNYGADLFLDGARVVNAAVAQGVPIRALTEPADQVVVSLNKGLGAPMGAVLCSTKEFIQGVKPIAKRSGMLAVHKAGIFAAAGIIALTKMVEGLEDDHRRARRLAKALSEMDGLYVDMDTVQTNLFRVSTEPLGITSLELGERVAKHGLGIHMLEPYAFKLALCYDIDDKMVDQAIEIFRKVINEVKKEGVAKTPVHATAA